MSRMVSHSTGDKACVTLNGDGSLLIAQGCTPFDEHDTGHVSVHKELGGAQVYKPVNGNVDEIVANVKGDGILCRFHDGHFDVVDVAHGSVR